MKMEPPQTRRLAEFKHSAPLHACAFDPTGRFVLAGGRDRDVVCLDVAGGTQTKLAGHDSWVSSIARAGDRLVVSADYAGGLIAWDCAGESPRPGWKIAAHPNTVYALAVSPDGRLIATGDRDGTIRIWHAEQGQLRQELQIPGQPVYGLVFHPHGTQLIAADRQPQKPRLKWWDLSAAKELRSIDVPPLSAYRRVEDIEWGGIRGLTISTNGQTLVACGSNGYSGPACALLFHAESGELQNTLTSTLKGFYYAARFHPQGPLLTVGGDVAKGEFCVWDPAQKEALAKTDTVGPCTGLDLHPEGSSFAVTQTIGKGSYPDAGTLTIFAWAVPA